MDRKIDFVTNEADERPIYAVFGDILWCRDTGNEYIYDGSTWQEYKMRYKDLGLVIDAVNVAAEATVTTAELDLSWATELYLVGGISDQPYSVKYFRKNKNGITDFGTLISSGSSALTTRFFTITQVPFTKSTKFSFSNVGTGIGSIAKLSIVAINNRR